MHTGSSGLGMGTSKVVATLRADGNVYPTEAQAPFAQLSNLTGYEIRTENELLLNKGNIINATTVVDLGKQLLQCARDSDVAGVKAALGHGAPFASDWLGMSALHFAAMNNQVEICEILLKGGINIDAKTKVDRTPLHLACYYGNVQIVVLLLSKKCAVNTRDMLRMTPLHWAVEKRHKEIVRLLLLFNADVTLASKFGKTPIGLAVLTEQADILAELEAARRAQANRVLNEETEKETSEAVNSIMEEPEPAKSVEEGDMSVEDRMDVLENLRRHTNMLGDSALNMLKTHGIADMMQDNDDDASKEMLNTALQNGRQLVLSEGGRMLLHETKTKPGTNGIISNSQNKNNNNLGKAVPSRPISNQSPQKIRMNVIKRSEASTTATTGVTKNKNIRIISLSDFKKLCRRDSQTKCIQKIPATLASSGVIRQLSDGTKLVNMRQVQSRQLKLPTVHKKGEGGAIEDQQQMSNDAITPATNSPATTSTRGQVGTVQTLQLRPLSSTGVSVVTNNGTTTKTTTPTTFRTNMRSESSTMKAPNVMPLLSSSEICRQLHELRRQNEELRRRFDLVEREKEEMLHRIEQLEQLIIVRDSEPDVEFVV
ncbi:uncharacterized protein LOC115632452 isoform X2 [Scaptodrosophila lebanonensis]|uniref:Uncharacterized protein LOC115632452 isoform X2 n=1 Tax=Drosophila lebanonensis TaxID=7225 RepID=A0A6J2UAT6_DROLE|nr:uncharacterized protein LOC115632452 isoform X2 [Scaptodrosophila lebanonensis]